MKLENQKTRESDLQGHVVGHVLTGLRQSAREAVFDCPPPLFPRPVLGVKRGLCPKGPRRTTENQLHHKDLDGSLS